MGAAEADSATKKNADNAERERRIVRVRSDSPKMTAILGDKCTAFSAFPIHQVAHYKALAVFTVRGDCATTC
jgi:hypothetical protein